MNPRKEYAAAGSQNKPDPHTADYYQDLDEDFFSEIDKHADQEDLEKSSEVVRCFDWKR